MEVGWRMRRRREGLLLTIFWIFSGQVGGQTSQQILNAVEVKATYSMNESLLKEFTVDEVRRALDNISDLKAPGPDGMPTIVYKNY